MAGLNTKCSSVTLVFLYRKHIHNWVKLKSHKVTKTHNLCTVKSFKCIYNILYIQNVIFYNWPTTLVQDHNKKNLDKTEIINYFCAFSTHSNHSIYNYTICTQNHSSSSCAAGQWRIFWQKYLADLESDKGTHKQNDNHIFRIWCLMLDTNITLILWKHCYILF